MMRRTVKILLGCLALMTIYVVFSNVVDLGNHPIWTIKKSKNASVLTKVTSTFKDQTTTPSNLNIKHHIPSTIGNVITKNAKGWINLDNICDVQPDFKLVNLTSPVNTYIYVYEERVDTWVSGSIIKQGSWEGGLVKRLYDLLVKDKELVFVDLGANIGMFTLAAAKSGRHVYAVDCLKSNVMRLCASVRKGRLDDSVTIIYNALSNIRGNVTLGSYSGNVGGTYVKQSDNSAPGASADVVSAVLLDDLLDLIKAKKAIMKMDVETFEKKILEGGEQFFTKIQVQYLLMEFKTHRGKESGKFIVDFLDRHGLEPYTTYGSPNIKLSPNDTNKWPGDVLWKRKDIIET